MSESPLEATQRFYVTGGTMQRDAPSYVVRQADRDLFEGLLAGEFCYLSLRKTPSTLEFGALQDVGGQREER